MATAFTASRRAGAVTTPRSWTDRTSSRPAQAAGNPGSLQWHYGRPVINPAGTPNGSAALAPGSSRRSSLPGSIRSGARTTRRSFSGATLPGPGLPLREVARPRRPWMSSPSDTGPRIPGRTAFAKVDYIHRDLGQLLLEAPDPGDGKVTDPSRQRIRPVRHGERRRLDQRKYQGIQVQAQWTPGGVQRRRQLHLLDAEGQRRRRRARGPRRIRNLPLKVYYPEYLAYDARKPIGYLPAGQQAPGARLGRLYPSDSAAFRAGSA